MRNFLSGPAPHYPKAIPVSSPVALLHTTPRLSQHLPQWLRYTLPQGYPSIFPSGSAPHYPKAIPVALLHTTPRLSQYSFIQTISIAPLQVHSYSEVLPTQHGYCAGVSRRSATGHGELRTCPRSLRDG